MSLKVFLELVEIKAKTASVLPFLLGVCFSYYYYHSLNWANLLLFFIAMFLFNMSVDAWDNYNDYHNALDKEEYKQKTNIIGRENLSPREVLWMLLGMAGIATVLGLVLVVRTGWPLLLMGMFCGRDLIFRWATSTIEFTSRRVLFWLYHGWNDHADKYLYQYLSRIYV